MSYTYINIHFSGDLNRKFEQLRIEHGMFNLYDSLFKPVVKIHDECRFRVVFEVPYGRWDLIGLIGGIGGVGHWSQRSPGSG